MYKPKLTLLQQDILRLLFIRAGESLNARNIANILKVSQPAVSKALPALEKTNYIKVSKDKTSKRLSIDLDRDNPQAIWLKRADNMKQIYESGLVDFIYENFAEATVILFGSYAFGEDTVRSDIDLAIIGSKEKDVDLSRFEKLLERPIVMNYFKSFKSIDNHLLNNIVNGITLKGAVDI